jgi:NAD(P)-dependent dehydrogenase (short-subunit alcohol dehydrogenase family)
VPAKADFESSAKAEDEVLAQRYGGPESIAAVQAFLASRRE